MPEPLTLVVQLQVNPDHRDDYERFEAAAARIMERHGGRIERRITLAPSPNGSDADDLPSEVHIVTFPDRASLDAYRTDPGLEPLRETRERAILRTVVWTGSDLPGFA